MLKAFDISMILYAEHDFAASTFSARITASTRSDYHSSIISAIATLRGNLHGGANEAAMEFLTKLKNIKDANKTIDDCFKNKKIIMGFGHRVYKNGDPRSTIIK